MLMEKYKEALKAFDTAVSLDNTIKEIYENRAKCYRKMAEIELEEEKKTE